MSPYRILSLDGGGIRGILSAAILERLEQARPGLIGQIDLFAGTSTGGILSLGLASGLSPGEARQLYERLGGIVFKDSLIDNILDLGTLRGAQYSLDPLRKELTEQFGEMTLADLPKRVLISSFDLDNEAAGVGKVRAWKPKFFHNFPGPQSDGAQKVVDVALRTSAAPTYFPIYQGYIDGGVVAGNPSMCALAQALEPNTGGQKLRSVRLLSVGTGYNPEYLTDKNGDWGLIQWAPHIISLMLEGSGGLADYQCRQVMGDHYFRIDPVLPIPIGMDAVNQIELLKNIAIQLDLAPAIAWLKANFNA